MEYGLADFERFFYDEISFRNNLFKKPNLKTVYVMQKLIHSLHGETKSRKSRFMSSFSPLLKIYVTLDLF